MIDPYDPDSILAALQDGFEDLDLPEPYEVFTVGNPGLLAHYEVSFDDGPLHLQIRLHDLDGSGFNGAYLVSQLLAGDPRVPVVDQSLVVPLNILGYHAMVAPFVPGLNARATLLQEPQHAGAFNAMLGQVASALSEQEMASFGTRATPRGFTPERATWREEWLARLHRRVRAARAGGTALEPLFGQILRRVDELSGSLDGATEWSLVHGGLATDVITVSLEDVEPTIAGVFGWHGVFAGDHLAEWAPLLYLDDATLADVVAGYGAEQVRELLDPDRLARLEVYRLTQCIATMAAAASDIWPLELQPGAVNQAANLARAALDTPVGVRLERALNAQVESPLASPEDSYEKTRQQEVSNRLRFVLETLRRDPPLHAWEEPIWLVAAATSLIQADLPPSDEADAYADVAIRLFAMLPYQLGPRFAQSIDERGAWWRSLVRRVLDHHRALPEMTYRTSLPSLWVASQVIDRLDHVMDVGVLRGIESMIEGTLHKERISASQEVPAALALAQGVMARAGAAALIADLELEGYDEVNEILAGQVSEAWDILDMGVTTDDLPDLEDYVDFYAYADRQQGLAAPLAPLVLALRWLPAEDLPATPQAILAAVGIQAPYDDDDDW